MSVNSNVPGRSTSFEQMLVEWNEIYLQNEKLKGQIIIQSLDEKQD